MNDLFQTERTEKLIPRYRNFLKEHIYPIELNILSKPFRQTLEQLGRIREFARSEKLFAPHLPADAGGLDLTLTEFAQVSEVLGTSPLGHFIFNCQAPDIGNMELLHHYGSDELKQQFLKPLQQGMVRSCFAMTEPAFAGSNPVYLGTTAIRNGTHYVINGHKWFTTGADGASFTIVMALTDPENSNPYERASMILVPMHNSGIEFVRNISIMGDPGEDYMSHGELKFNQCKVPVSNRIGDEGKGFALAQARLGPGRIHHCMRWIGICERAFQLMCEHAITRQLDDKRKLAHQQIIQQWIAECRASINAARLMVLHTARTMENHATKSAKDEISMIKFFVADVLMNVLDKAVQVHGALGVTDDTLLAFWYRHERASRIYDGPDEVHKTSVAKSILKSFGFDSKS